MKKGIYSGIVILILIALVIVFSTRNRTETESGTVTEPFLEIPSDGQEQPQREVENPQVQSERKNTIRTIQTMTIETTQQGQGAEIVNGQIAVVHYTGKLTNGTVFDSSKTRGIPFEFPLGAGMVIQGWEKGVLGMKVGETRILTIPPEMGYGERGAAGVIPPNATLIFEVELLAIK